MYAVLLIFLQAIALCDGRAEARSSEEPGGRAEWRSRRNCMQQALTAARCVRRGHCGRGLTALMLLSAFVGAVCLKLKVQPPVNDCGEVHISAVTEMKRERQRSVGGESVSLSLFGRR